MAPRSSIIESLLAGSTKEGRGNDFFNYKNPYYMAGGAIDEMRMPAAQTTTQAVLLPILQGLAGGALSGYGARKAKEEAYDYYRKQPGLSSLYSSETRPEGWDADQGQLDQLRVLAQVEEAKKAALEEQKKREEMEKFLRGKSLMMTPDGKVVPDPELVAANLEIFRGEQKAKGELNPSGVKINNLPALGTEVIDRVSDMNVTGDTAIKLAEDIRKAKPTWASIQGGKYFAFMDKSGFAQRAKIAANDYVRAMSGTAVPPAEREMADRMLTGDPTLSPQEMADYMERFGKTLKSRARAKVNTIRDIQSGAFESGLGGPPIDGGLGIPTGKIDKKTGKPIYIINGVQGVHD